MYPTRSPLNASMDGSSSKYKSIKKDRSVIATVTGAPMLKAGYLFKKGSVRHNWNKRWFELRLHSLAYFQDRKSTLVKGEIPLQSCLVEEVTHKNRSFVFAIVGYNRTYLMAGRSDKELVSWMKAIIKCTFVIPIIPPLSPVIQPITSSSPPPPPAMSIRTKTELVTHTSPTVFLAADSPPVTRVKKAAVRNDVSSIDRQLFQQYKHKMAKIQHEVEKISECRDTQQRNDHCVPPLRDLTKSYNDFDVSDQVFVNSDHNDNNGNHHEDQVIVADNEITTSPVEDDTNKITPRRAASKYEYVRAGDSEDEQISTTILELDEITSDTTTKAEQPEISYADLLAFYHNVTKILQEPINVIESAPFSFSQEDEEKDNTLRVIHQEQQQEVAAADEREQAVTVQEPEQVNKPQHLVIHTNIKVEPKQALLVSMSSMNSSLVAIELCGDEKEEVQFAASPIELPTPSFIPPQSQSIQRAKSNFSFSPHRAEYQNSLNSCSGSN